MDPRWLRIGEHRDLRKQVLVSFRLKDTIRTIDSEGYGPYAEPKDSVDQDSSTAHPCGWPFIVPSTCNTDDRDQIAEVCPYVPWSGTPECHVEPACLRAFPDVQRRLRSANYFFALANAALTSGHSSDPPILPGHRLRCPKRYRVCNTEFGAQTSHLIDEYQGAPSWRGIL